MLEIDAEEAAWKGQKSALMAMSIDRRQHVMNVPASDADEPEKAEVLSLLLEIRFTYTVNNELLESLRPLLQPYGLAQQSPTLDIGPAWAFMSQRDSFQENPECDDAYQLTLQDIHCIRQSHLQWKKRHLRL